MHEDGFVEQDVPEGKGLDREVEVNEDKLVPVSESIRYRKRAQAAEVKLAELEQAYQEQASELGGLQEKMVSMQVEQRLREELTSAQVVDMETAMLIVKDRLGACSDDGDLFSEKIQGVMEQVRNEKPFLFGDVGPKKNVPEGNAERPESVSKTQGVKGVRSGSPNKVLQQAAEAAVQSGSRSDVQEYLRLRRRIV